MKETYQKLEAQGRIGPMMNINPDTSKTPILQPRPDYRAEYPKLVVVGEANGKRIKKLVHNSHEELALKATPHDKITTEMVRVSQIEQRAGAAETENAALRKKLNESVAMNEELLRRLEKLEGVKGETKTEVKPEVVELSKTGATVATGATTAPATQSDLLAGLMPQKA